MIHHQGNPEKRANIYRTLLESYYRMLDAVDADRSERQGSVTLSERIAMAGVRQDICKSIAHAQTQLKKLARLGGHGHVIERQQ
ncbi:hypothetical protein ACIGHF_00410 [Stenotrophomonas sp. NPDC077464]|uniref:hypothetical protein n=1 Tax=unclassified Stenotrophomonas TaxID=196198 RepID=UPI0037D313A5